MIQKTGTFLAFIFLLLTGNIYVASAQSGEIRGFVYDIESGEPILFTNVYFEGTSIGTTTNSEGYYQISDVPVGTYTLMSTYLGYDTMRTEVSIREDRIVTQNIYLNPRGIDLDVFDVTGRRQEREESVGMSKVTLRPAEIRRMPSVGSEPDLVQYLQMIPGVVFSGDQGGQLYVRGGAPVHNKVLIDGMSVFNPFHSIGLFSVFDVDAIRSVDVHTAGFGASHGGRISSVMDIEMRDGNRRRHTGNVSVNPFVAGTLIEGPIREMDENQRSTSYLFSARGSYLEQSAPVFYDHADTSGLPYNFLDFFGKVSMQGPGGNKLSLHTFRFTDRVNFQNTTNYEWDAFGIGSEFMLLPGGASTLMKGHIAYSNYEVSQIEVDREPSRSYVSNFEAGMNFTYFLGDDKLHYGFDASGFQTDFEFYNISNRRITQTNFTTELGVFIEAKKLLGNFVIEPGFRMHYYASHQEVSLEPRLAIQYNLSDWVRLKFAGGLYSQNIISAHSDRDVVNLFYGYLSGPENIPDKFDGDAITSKLQKAQHLVAGVEFDVSTRSSISVETYYKRFNQLTNINRNKQFDNTPQNSDQPEILRQDYIIESGNAYGIDFHLLYDQSPFYIWLAYSLGFVDRYDGNIEYHPHWDRRHNVNLMASYDFGTDNSWQVSARWNLGSGFPFTKTKGFYEHLDFQDGLGTNYTSAGGSIGTIYDDESYNQGRLPYYHRLDLSLNKSISFSRYRKLELNASVINAYNRENIFFFDRTTHTRVNQLPVLPSLGVKYHF